MGFQTKTTMAQADDWDTASFANHNQYYNDQLFSQMHQVENRFRALREHLNGNIPHDIKANEQEMEDRIEKIRHLQNDIFKMQFKQFSVHEFKAKAKDKQDDPFGVGTSNKMKKTNSNKSKHKTKVKGNSHKNVNNDNDEMKMDKDDIETEEKQHDEYSNPFLLDDDEENNEEKGDSSKHDQYGKYQDILDSFDIENNTTTALLKKLRATTTKMKELNDLALGKHRQRQ